MLACSEPYQTSKMERFVRIVMGKTYTIEIVWFFNDFHGPLAHFNWLTQNWLILKANFR